MLELPEYDSISNQSINFVINIENFDTATHAAFIDANVFNNELSAFMVL